MSTVGHLTEHQPGFRSSIGSFPSAMDFKNNDDYMNGFSNALLFKGDAFGLTPSNLYPGDPLLYNANYNTNPSRFLEKLPNDDNNIIKMEDDGEGEPNSQTPVKGPPTKMGLLSPEMEPRVTRQTEKKKILQKGEDEIKPSKDVSKKKELKARRQPKRESVTKASTSMETSTSISSGGKRSNRRDKSLERNRAAASKCRKRKKQWTDNLETKKSTLEAHNKNLHVQCCGLIKEASQLKNMLITHAGCNDPNIDIWVENEATKYVWKLSNPQGMEQQGSSFAESMSHLQGIFYHISRQLVTFII